MKNKPSEARKREKLALALHLSAVAIQFSQGFRKRRVKSLDMATIYFQAAITELSYGMEAEMPIVMAAFAKAVWYTGKSIRKKKPSGQCRGRGVG